jgi:hypothetical protein
MVLGGSRMSCCERQLIIARAMCSFVSWTDHFSVLVRSSSLPNKILLLGCGEIIVPKHWLPGHYLASPSQSPSPPPIPGRGAGGRPAAASLVRNPSLLQWMTGIPFVCYCGRSNLNTAFWDRCSSQPKFVNLLTKKYP